MKNDSNFIREYHLFKKSSVKKVKNCEIRHCYISTLFNILALHIKSQNHGVSALKSVKL